MLFTKTLCLLTSLAFGLLSTGSASMLLRKSSPTESSSTKAIEDHQDADRLIELAHAIQVLQDAGVDMDQVGWGRKPEPEQKLIGTSYLIRLKGVDIDTMSVEEQAFAEDAVAFAFNEANKATDYGMRTSHLLTIQPEPTGQTGSGGAGGGDAILGGPSRNSGYYTYWHGTSNMGCRMCRDDRFLFEAEGGTTVTRHGVTYNRSPIVEAWEDKLTTVLKTSRFEVFHELDDLSIDIDTNLVPTESGLAAVTSSA